MYASLETTIANKSRAVAYTVGPKKGNVTQAAGFMDKRPLTEAQKVIQRKDIRSRDQSPIQLTVNDAKHAILNDIDFYRAKKIMVATSSPNGIINIIKDLYSMEDNEGRLEHVITELLKNMPLPHNGEGVHLGDVYTALEETIGKVAARKLMVLGGASEVLPYIDGFNLPKQIETELGRLNLKEKFGVELIYENSVNSGKAGSFHITIHSPILRINEWNETSHTLYGRYYVSKKKIVQVSAVNGVTDKSNNYEDVLEYIPRVELSVKQVYDALLAFKHT